MVVVKIAHFTPKGGENRWQRETLQHADLQNMAAGEEKELPEEAVFQQQNPDINPEPLAVAKINKCRLPSEVAYTNTSLFKIAKYVIIIQKKEITLKALITIMLKFYLKKLKNNLTLFVIKTKKLSSLDITLYIKTGSVYENKNNNGISHLLEHLLFLKTKQSKLNLIALDIYPYTKKDFTYFEITTHKDLLNAGLSTLFSVISSPDFIEKNLATVKNIAKEELAGFYENPYDILNQKIDAFLYKNNNLALNIGGNEKSIENIAISDLKEWYNNYYHPNNMILTLVGNININETVKKINNILCLNSVPKNKNKKINKIIYPVTSKLIHLKNNTNFQQTYLAFVFPTSGVDSSNYINFILLGKILNKKIRQIFENSGLFYDIQLYYHHYLNTGEFRIITACKKNNVNTILKKIDSFVKNNKISISSFEKLKDYIEYQFMLKEDNVDELSSLSLYLLKDKPKLITPKNEINKIKNIKFNEINQIKRKYFNKKNSYYFMMN